MQGKAAGAKNCNRVLDNSANTARILRKFKGGANISDQSYITVRSDTVCYFKRAGGGKNQKLCVDFHTFFEKTCFLYERQLHQGNRSCNFYVQH